MKSKLKKIIGLMKQRDVLITASSTLMMSSLLFLFTPHFAHAGIGESIAKGLASAANFIFGNIFEAVMRLIAWIMSLFTSLGGQALDMSIRYSINGANLGGQGIVTGWSIFRDLVNMTLIFILLYVSIMTILQASAAQTKRTIVSLVLVGLFINFSFFITGFVIDIGNAFATGLYNSATPGNTEISGILIDRMNLTDLKESISNKDGFQSGLAYMLNAIFFAVAGFVFFAGAFLFLFRHVSLMFILMLSPLAFAALILPQTKRHWNKWLNTLLQNTFVAPIYMLLVVITLTIASASDLIVNADSPDLQVGTAGNISSPILDSPGMLMNYIVIIGLMIGSLTVSKQISGSLAGNATKWAGKVTGLGAGAIGIAGRRTIGRAGRALSESEALKERASKGGIRGYGARAAMRVGDASGKASFDVRGGALGSTLKSTTGVNFGKAGGKGGYDKVRKDKNKREVDFAKSLGQDSTKVAAAKKTEVSAKAEHARSQKQFDQSRTDLRNAELELDIARRKKNTKPEELEARYAQVRQAQETHSRIKDQHSFTKEAQDSASKTVKATETERQTGYANVLDKRTGFSSAFGLTASNREAAKAIRKDKPTLKQIKEVLEKGGELDDIKTDNSPAPDPEETSSSGGDESKNT